MFVGQRSLLSACLALAFVTCCTLAAWRSLRPPTATTPPVRTLLTFGDAAPRAISEAVAPDLAWVATGTREGKILLRSGDCGRLLFGWQAHSEPVTALAAFAGCPRLVSASRDGEVRIWSITLQGAERVATTLVGGPVLSAAVSPDGQALALGSVGKITLWRIGTCGLSPDGELVAPDQYLISALAFSPDGRLLAASGTGDGLARVWRLGEAGPPAALEASAEATARGLCFTPDGGGLMVLDTDGNLSRRALDGVEHWRRRLPIPACRHGAFSADGHYLLIGHFNGSARLLALSEQEHE